MEESAYIFRLLLITLICAISSMYCGDTGDVCIKKTPCRCEFSNGTFIDLTPSAKSIAFKSSTTYMQSQSGARLSTFYYHPCFDISMNSKDSSTSNTCNHPSALCWHGSEWTETAPGTLKKAEESFRYTGSSSDSAFAPDGSYINYLNLPSQTIVHLVCTRGDAEDRLEVKDLSDPSRFELLFYSRNACLQPDYGNFNMTNWNVPLIQIACRTLMRMTNSTDTTV